MDAINEEETSGDRQLDPGEVHDVIKKLGVTMNDDEFASCFDELKMSSSSASSAAANDKIELQQLIRWWFITKTGRPRPCVGMACPETFLNALCVVLRPRAFPPGERMIRQGSYADNFVLLIDGIARIDIEGADVDLGSMIRIDHLFGRVTLETDPEWNEQLAVKHTDREPIIGLAACLDDMQLARLKIRIARWSVFTQTYCDSLWVTRKHLLRCLDECWREGKDKLAEMAYYQCAHSSDATALFCLCMYSFGC